MTPAHERLITLMSAVISDGFGPWLGIVRKLPALADALPDLSPDVLAARHHAAWAQTVQPFRSVFLSADALVHGDPLTEHLAAHVGAADLLDWLPPVVLGIRSARLSEHTALVELLWELSVELPYTSEVGALLPDPLTDDARVRDLAEALAVPFRTGAVLTGPAIDAIGSRAEVPSGFGGRADRLEHLLRSGAELDRTAHVLEALDAWLEARDAEYAALGGPVGPWRARIAATRGWLGRVRAVTSEPPPPTS